MGKRGVQKERGTYSIPLFLSGSVDPSSCLRITLEIFCKRPLVCGGLKVSAAVSGRLQL